jgi:uncharacterized protein (TIGR02246 family)
MSAFTAQRLSTGAPAAPPTGTPSAEEAVRELFQKLLDAWGRGDGTAYGDLFTADADYVAFDGSRTVGREQIASSHQQLFETWLKGTRLVGQVDSVRFLSPAVALVHATGATLMPGKEKPQRPSIQTLVATTEEGPWRFTAFHNCRVVRRNGLQWMLYGLGARLFGR